VQNTDGAGVFKIQQTADSVKERTPRPFCSQQVIRTFV